MLRRRHGMRPPGSAGVSPACTAVASRSVYLRFGSRQPWWRERRRLGRSRSVACLPIERGGGDAGGCAEKNAGGTPALPGGPAPMRICGFAALEAGRFLKKSCASCASMSINHCPLRDFEPVSSHQAPAFVSGKGAPASRPGDADWTKRFPRTYSCRGGGDIRREQGRKNRWRPQGSLFISAFSFQPRSADMPGAPRSWSCRPPPSARPCGNSSQAIPGCIAPSAGNRGPFAPMSTSSSTVTESTS